MYNNQKPTLVYNLEVYRQHNYTVGQDAILVHNCSGDDSQLTRDQVEKNGKFINEGLNGRVYKLDNEENFVYKIYKKPGMLGDETKAERNARVMLEINTAVPEFQASAVGKDQDILKMTELTFKNQLSFDEQLAVDSKFNLLIHKYYKVLTDMNLTNIGWLNGKPVFSDTDQIVSLFYKTDSEIEMSYTSASKIGTLNRLDALERKLIGIQSLLPEERPQGREILRNLRRNL